MFVLDESMQKYKMLSSLCGEAGSFDWHGYLGNGLIQSKNSDYSEQLDNVIFENESKSHEKIPR